ncbi:mechanosensitive ion channel [Puniceicoccaceae bacterium K14]|nr:mechanosensitive ion channel [Puniceicoccaceae bacterium K14]
MINILDEDVEKLRSMGERITEFMISNAPNLIGALVIMCVGVFLSRILSKLIAKVCEARKIDVTLSRFFTSTAKVVVVIMFGVIAINRVGIEITPFIALLGASAFGVSLAVQGPISNYGAGIVLIITRPFKVDDTLNVQGRTGIVQEVNLGTTQLVTEDGEEITIPNRKVLGEILTNSFSYMVVEGVVGISYNSDPEKAIEAVTVAVLSVEAVAQEKEPQVGIQGFGDSSIDIGYRYWVPTQNYYKIQYAVNLAIFKKLAASKIEIPFPQRDVHIVSKESV